MKRWSQEAGERVENPKIDAFIEDVLGTCRKHNMSIGHEDSHGAFIVYGHFSEVMADWLRSAHSIREVI